MRNLSSYNERPQRTMTNCQLIFDEQQLHGLQVPHNWCLVICTFKERTHPNITPSHEKQRPGSCVNPKNGEKFPPFTSTFCSKSLSGCIKKHLIYRMWLMQQAFLHATGCKFSEQLRTYHDIKLRQEILFVTCIWVIASFKEPKLFVHSWQTSCFETCMKLVYDHFALVLRSSLSFLVQGVWQVISCTCLYPPQDQHKT